jgi:hypothetical protein
MFLEALQYPCMPQKSQRSRHRRLDLMRQRRDVRLLLPRSCQLFFHITLLIRRLGCSFPLIEMLMRLLWLAGSISGHHNLHGTGREDSVYNTPLQLQQCQQRLLSHQLCWWPSRSLVQMALCIMTRAKWLRMLHVGFRCSLASS